MECLVTGVSGFIGANGVPERVAGDGQPTLVFKAGARRTFAAAADNYADMHRAPERKKGE